MRVTLAQLNPIVGDIAGNLGKARTVISEFGNNTDLIIFPELFLTGYPPRDLLEKNDFLENIQSAVNELKEISKSYPETGLLMGTPTRTDSETGKGLYNSAVLIYRGEIAGSHHKMLLPAYDVFDERRYFETSKSADIIPFKEHNLGVTICEDMWSDPEFYPGIKYPVNPIKDLASGGAAVLINISASPFHIGKEETRFKIIMNHAAKYKLPFLFVNQVGGNDELVFDGRSIAASDNGQAVSLFPCFEEHVETVDISVCEKEVSYLPQQEIESVYQALIMGVRDYFRKCGFKKALVGLSGGIDSAVTSCLAREAIGGENVMGISMPSPYSSKESVDLSKELAANLDMDFKVIPINSVYQSYIDTLDENLSTSDDKEVGVYLQNIQARIRGNILMAFSNKLGYLVLTTGNKSEIAMGYCTLYGDMAGGLAVISDVPKTMVYELAEYINREKEIIPQEIITRPPSAELKPDQLDRDSLPPYDILDKILYNSLEEHRSVEEIQKMGLNPETVKSVIRTVNHNEYKRRQTPPGIKVTSKAFGMGRRMPVAAKY